MVQFNERTGYEPKHPEVLRVNPKGQVPVLVHGDLELFDSTQIMEYFEDLKPNPPLWPMDVRVRARARLLELESDEVFFPHVVRLMNLQDALGGPEAEAACEAIGYRYTLMEQKLDDQRFFFGESITHADIAFYMAQLFAERMGAPLSSTTPRLLRWRNRMSSRSSVQTALAPLIQYLRSNNRSIPAFLESVEREISKGDGGN